MIFGKWIGNDLIKDGHTIAAKHDVIKIHAINVSGTEYICTNSNNELHFLTHEANIECFGNAEDVIIEKEE